jgi:hypothetical protein
MNHADASIERSEVIVWNPFTSNELKSTLVSFFNVNAEVPSLCLELKYISLSLSQGRILK